MTRNEITRRFPNASEEFIRQNLSDAEPAQEPKIPPLKVKLIPTSKEAGLNMTETLFLQKLRDDPNVVWIGIQNLTFHLGDRCTYTPDFITVQQDGSVTYWEVKGEHIWEDSTIKTKWMAGKFPWFRGVRAQWRAKQWTFKEFKP